MPGALLPTLIAIAGVEPLEQMTVTFPSSAGRKSHAYQLDHSKCVRADSSENTTPAVASAVNMPEAEPATAD
jgi:hypothetical protein